MNITVAQIRKLIAEAIKPVRDRHRDSLRRVKIVSSDDSGPTRLLQVTGLRDAVENNVEHLEPFGFSSNPPAGAEAFEIKAGGSPSHPVIVVAFGRDYRLHVEPGESIVFNEWGDFVKLDKNRKITVNAGSEVDVDAPSVNINASTKCTITSPSTEVSGNLKVDGNIEVDGTSDLKGAVVAETTMTASTVAATTSLTIAGKEMGGHKHPVTTAPGTTGAPS